MLTKFQFHCSIACRDILYFVFWLPHCHTLWRHQYLICIIQKSWISPERDEIWQKGKHHSSSLLKAFQIRLFFNTSIFHFIGTLREFIYMYNKEWKLSETMSGLLPWEGVWQSYSAALFWESYRCKQKQERAKNRCSKKLSEHAYLTTSALSIDNMHDS